jgi:hypothetical protein
MSAIRAVSSVDQDLTVQREALDKAGVKVDFEDGLGHQALERACGP